MQRNPPPNSDPNLKIFTVRGSPQQIDYARQLVEEKIGVSTVISTWPGVPKHIPGAFPALHILHVSFFDTPISGLGVSTKELNPVWLKKETRKMCSV